MECKHLRYDKILLKIHNVCTLRADIVRAFVALNNDSVVKKKKIIKYNYHVEKKC